MSLNARFAVPDRDVDIDLVIPRGTTTALVGPNGAGKSTVLQVLAGLLAAQGSASLDDDVLFETGHSTAPHRRGVAMLAQEPLLFPRMTAARNVSFALRARGIGRREADIQARKWLDDVAAGEFADRLPRHLSGGQAQRVAIARALAASPRLLLLDEPLAALDVDVAAGIRSTLHRLLNGRMALLVTHEILDAALLADHIAVVQDGRIVEHGPTQAILREPRTDFAAQICGLNILRGVAAGGDRVRCEVGDVVGAENVLRVGEEAIAAFSPASVAVHKHRPEGSPRNLFTARVLELRPQRHLMRLHTDLVDADLTPTAIADLAVHPGDMVHLAVKAAEVRLYSA
ncbi:MAG: ABC transporter ATP-binding protein [Candidatus Nanopelagicales bacterium]|jgi:molybdate transport system ATP-binding protein|nr:ABC transporter ATP-binding protein [Candidatus Nanopelagicales bacterium]